MKNKIIPMIIGLSVGLLVGCTTIPTVAETFGFTEADSWGMFRVGLTDSIKDFVDKETGVHYLAVFDDSSLNAICPRYNSDGSLMVDNTEVDYGD